MPSLQTRLTSLQRHIADVARQVGRSDQEIRLLAVSKKQPSAAILEAAAVGQRDFGENYLQEAVEKIQQCDVPGLCWHFIGAIQSRKAADIARWFDWVHTVDRIKVANKLNQHRHPSLPALNVLLQVNLDEEAQKAGVAPTDCLALAQEIQQLPRLKLRGLMCIPAPRSNYDEQLEVFGRLYDLRQELAEVLGRPPEFDQLSMGMSGDYGAAIAAGSTMLRIGTAIFGARQ